MSDHTPADRRATQAQLLEDARRATDKLRDWARNSGMHHFARDPLVVAVHRAIDLAEELAALRAPSPVGELEKEACPACKQQIETMVCLKHHRTVKAEAWCPASGMNLAAHRLSALSAPQEK